MSTTMSSVKFNNQLEKAVKAMKDKYKQCQEKRRPIIVIENKTMAAPQKQNPEEAPKPKKEKPNKTQKMVPICCATKMNGEKCTAKAKEGSQFCGRHMPK